MSSGTKKPTGGRPLPRRLFSLESLKKQRTPSESDAVSISSRTSHWRKQSTASSNLLALSENIEEGHDPFGDTAHNAWTEKGVVQSPTEEYGDPLGEDAPTPRPPKTPATARPDARQNRANIPPLNLGGTLIAVNEGDIPPPSPSRRRWDTIRSAVLPTSPTSRGPTPPPMPVRPEGQLEPPHTAGSGGPARPSTPRGYRFGQKRSMRHVVEQVRDVAHDETRRLTEEIRKACLMVRFGELPSRSQKADGVVHNTIGSTLHLPFLQSANASVSTAGGSGSGNTGGSSHVRQMTGGLRRPQSVASLGASARAVPTVTHLARALTSSTSVNRPKTLPCETQVLAALLVPFLGPRNNEQIAVEQQTAVETFEYAIRTWRSASSEAELDRCIWCCKAASVYSRSRMRILGSLSSILFSRERTFQLETPAIFQTLLQHLFSLLALLRSSADSQAEAESVAGYIAAIKGGQSGTPTQQALEKEYGVRHSKKDSDEKIREIILAESVIGCMEVGSEASRRWTLHHLIESYWSSSDSTSLSPLLTAMTWRKLKTFVNSSVSLLSPSSSQRAIEDTDVIIHLLRTRILPEVEGMQDDAFAVVGEIQSSIIRLVLELLCVRGSSNREYVMLYFCHWIQDNGRWRQSVEQSLQEFIIHGEWTVILRLMPILEELPEETRTSLIPQLLPALSERLINHPPEIPCPPLSNFLESAAISCPKAFFKPIFTCAASLKDLTIANQLCVLHSFARFYPALWIHDPEMMSVALMQDPAASRAGSQILTTSTAPAHSKARYGQMVIMIELLQHIKRVRQSKDATLVTDTAKFVIALEARLGMLIEAKEQHTLIPASQRLLFCALFRECRLLTRSLKTASWLSSVVNWTSSYIFHEDTDPEEGLNEDEVVDTFMKLGAVYEQAKAGLRGGNKRRTTVVTPSRLEPQQSTSSVNAGVADNGQDAFGDQLATLQSLVTGRLSTALELLVAVSGLLQPMDYMQLGPILWYQHLNDVASHVIVPTCFLVMQCAERIPDEFVALIQKDLSSFEVTIRRNALQRVATLASWRFQLLSQEVILDRTYRRPFKLTRPHILFVPTDIGTSAFEMEEDPNDFKDSKGHVLPLELRRRLSEVGWAEERGEMDPKTEWIKTPLSRLPTQQLDSLSTNTEGDPTSMEVSSASPSPELSPTRSPRESPLGRKDSTTGGHTKAKRRPVFASTMVSLFPKLASMVKDSDFVVSNIAKNVVLDLMRDDPALLSRGVFHELSGDAAGVISAVKTLRDFLHCEFVLPPGAAHHILNHVTGFLKSSMRHTEAVNPLQGYGYTAPILAKLVSQVSKMSIRDIRRAKVDMLLLSSGSLWWNDSAPSAPMFPRALEALYDPFDTLPAPVVWVTMVRTAQNMLLLNMLRRNSQEVKVFRKHLSKLVLPVNFDDYRQTAIALTAYIPSQEPPLSPPNVALTSLSLTLARSHLLLLHQVFRSMSRHLNDREELALLLDGINRILLAHGDDVGIVAHAMLNYLVASTRFRRLFTSGGGYTMFMPAVLKVYCESQSHLSIRAIIEFSVNRFFALHQESFIFQTCDIMSNVISLPGADGPYICQSVFTLLNTLKSNAPLSRPEVASLNALNRVEEQEAIMVTIAEKVPSAFLASVHRNTQDKNQVTVDVPDQFDSKRLGLDDLVRLFLTVIAHNPSIQRAQQFVRFLMFLTPHLFHGSASARTVLRDGITALGVILLNKGSAKAKSSEGASLVEELGSSVSQTGLSQAGLTQSSVASDFLVMRLDFLTLVANFTKAGGQLSPLAAQRTLEVVKIVLKDSRASVPQIATFMEDYVRAVLVRTTHPELKQVVSLLSDIAPIISSYATSADWSGVFDVLTELASDPVYANQATFSRVLVAQFCHAGLEACDVAASENLLWMLPIRGSLLKMMDRSLLVIGADVISELERCEPTYGFLAGVLMPFVLRMKTTVEIASDSQWAEKWRRETYSKAWMRLLAYVLKVIQRADFINKSESRTPALDRRKSTDSRSSATSPDPQPAMALVVALQVLKIIMTRAEQDLSALLPGIWGQIGSVLRDTLADGDAGFAVPTRAGYSEPPSPTHSPKASAFNIGDENPFLTPSMTPSLINRRAQRRPRILDYMTWSLIEWLCLRRNPLALQMRVFVQEKVAVLHQELSSTAGPSFGFGLGFTTNSGATTPLTHSPFASPLRPRSGSTSRPVSSIFSKPRRSTLNPDAPAPGSALSTPRSSALFPAAAAAFDDHLQLAPPSTPRKPSTSLAEDHAGPARQAGYTLMPSPLTPTRRAARESGPKIVHLGPVRPPSPSPSQPDARRSLSRGRSGGGGGSGGTGGARTPLALARAMAVDSPVLVRATVRRIRVAQAMLGYPPLALALAASSVDSATSAELGGDGFEPPEGLVRAWSRAEAVDALVQETKDLIDEWREDGEFGAGDEPGILVDMDEGGQF